MKRDSLRTLELLSVEDKQGRYVIRISVDAGSEANAPRELELQLDELTYQGLGRLAPLSTGRARLSPYAQYDPFKLTYLSSIVKIGKHGGESYYFDCSAEYASMLESLRAGKLPESESEVACTSPSAAVIEEAGSSSLSLEAMAAKVGAVIRVSSIRLRPYLPVNMRRYALKSLRLLMLTCMLLLAWFELEGQIYIDDAKALSEHQTVIFEGTDNGVLGAGAANGHASLTEGASGAASLATVGAGSGGSTEADFTSNQGDSGSAGTGDDSSETTDQSATEPVGDHSDVESIEGGVASLATEFEHVEVMTLDPGSTVYSLPKGYVALTFDDGPSDYTKAIVDLLRERGVAGTFLFIGRNADRYTVEAAYAAEQGMAVGNHSWDHSNLTTKEMDDISANIAKANEVIGKHSDALVSVFRPPYGALNDDMAIAAEELGMKMLMWNRDPKDWQAATSKEIIRYFKTIDASGGIYVMHEKKATLDALPDIIDYLLEQDLKFAVFQ
ncbi:polysaccharide deacetylase family protein [Paenibacillus sp. PAMC21692]|uniref:polysaccharide deacetylase family protein n=1 Tax=Paenibacillus sp. PAMC21692 TaxID=2762320 RepID=UPI00164D3E22|nr:polysaccharide deacetylase family protein [Paenibacillus sp. PAMC21692]QNK58207.1 polysaccharide deacetylase family protein [Paenibacillus sp. PAMC21692]